MIEKKIPFDTGDVWPVICSDWAKLGPISQTFVEKSDNAREMSFHYPPSPRGLNMGKSTIINVSG
jgi:hypothetical protein